MLAFIILISSVNFIGNKWNVVYSVKNVGLIQIRIVIWNTIVLET